MLLSLLACEPRPDEAPELYNFDPDAMEVVDGDVGLVRVHYTREGVNAVSDADVDDDGVPDDAQATASLAERYLDAYAELGFLPPVTEAEVDAEEGGSGALDVYIVDLADTGKTGMNRQGACDGDRCSTWIEIDPTDLGRGTLAHELFHAVQGAYDYGEATWLDEGTASWQASRVAGSGDTFGWAWLRRHTCALAEMEVGDCADAGYGTALMWRYFDDTFGPQVLLHTWEAAADTDDSIDALDDALVDEGTSLQDEWPRLMAYALATGPRADLYTERRDVLGLEADAEGFPLRMTANIEPLSVRFYRLDHPGGELWAGVTGDARHLRISVHPVADGSPDGVLGPMTGPAALPDGGDLDLGSYDAGGIWIVVSNPELHGLSTPVDLCFENTPCEPGCGGLSFAPVLLGGAQLWRRRSSAARFPRARASKRSTKGAVE